MRLRTHRNMMTAKRSRARAPPTAPTMMDVFSGPVDSGLGARLGSVGAGAVAGAVAEAVADEDGVPVETETDVFIGLGIAV